MHTSLAQHRMGNCLGLGVLLVLLVASCGRTSSFNGNPLIPTDGSLDAAIDNGQIDQGNGGPDAAPDVALVDAPSDAGIDSVVDVVDDVNVPDSEPDSVTPPDDSGISDGDIDEPDLWVRSLTANVFNVSGQNRVIYVAEVCNQGDGPAGASRVDIYVNRATAPPPGLTGDRALPMVPLAPGACSTAATIWVGLAAGTYSSWAQSDVPAVVVESDENNNVFGPLAVVVPSVTLSCTDLCNFALNCSFFTSTTLFRCTDWCATLSPTEHQCQSVAVTGNNCAAFEACAPVPPPFCDELCDFLLGCNLVSPPNEPVCHLVCDSLSQTNAQCASNAMEANQCLDSLLCMFN